MCHACSIKNNYFLGSSNVIITANKLRCYPTLITFLLNLTCVLYAHKIINVSKYLNQLLQLIFGPEDLPAVSASFHLPIALVSSRPFAFRWVCSSGLLVKNEVILFRPLIQQTQQKTCIYGRKDVCRLGCVYLGVYVQVCNYERRDV